MFNYNKICEDITSENFLKPEPVIEKIKEEVSKVQLVNIFNEMVYNKNSEEINLIGSIQVNKEDIELVRQAVSLRKNVNNYLKGVSNITCYQRKDEDRIDFQAMLTEMGFAKFLWEKYKYVPKYIKENFEIKSPEIASVFLNHREEDFYIKYLEQKVNFDVKSQFLNNKYQSININQKSHKRFTEHGSDFYIVGLIDGDPTNFDSVKNVYFVMLTNPYFNKNAKAINTSTNPKFTPYYTLDIQPFKDYLKIWKKDVDYLKFMAILYIEIRNSRF